VQLGQFARGDVLNLWVESSSYEFPGLDHVGHVDVAGSLDRSDGRLALFLLNRDLSKAHDVELVWEDATPARALTGSLLTGDDLKASNALLLRRKCLLNPFPPRLPAGTHEV